MTIADQGIVLNRQSHPKTIVDSRQAPPPLRAASARRLFPTAVQPLRSVTLAAATAEFELPKQ